MEGKYLFVAVLVAILVVTSEGRARGTKLGYQTQYNHRPYAARQRQGVPPSELESYSTPGLEPLAESTTTATPSESSESLCQSAGFFPTPDSCVDYHRCVDFLGTGTHFTIFHFSCPTGTIFDAQLNTCNHIGWALDKRPECLHLASQSVVPIGSADSTTDDLSENADNSTDMSTLDNFTTESTTEAVTEEPIQPFSIHCGQTGQYHGHPIYCNKYYRCQWIQGDWVLDRHTCPAGLAFSEDLQSCSVDAECSTKMAEAPKPLPSTSEGEESTTEFYETTQAIEEADNSTDSMPDAYTTMEIPTGEEFECPAKGYFSYPEDCIRFYKCVLLQTGDLKGLLYKCPEGYSYSDEKRICDVKEKVTCAHDSPSATASSALTETSADLRQNPPARLLTEDDLKWFFLN